MIRSARLILAPLASLRLTVALFALAMVLIFAGTLAQRFEGNWSVVNAYFRSPWVLIPLRNLLFYDLPGAVPFPGGFTICVLLLVNLLAAHAVRFKLTRRRLGILTIHLGVILLLIGEIVTGLFAEESVMAIPEGGTAAFTTDQREVELAVVDASAPDRDRHVVIPQEVLRRHAGGEPIHDPLLPFTVRVDRWMPNAALVLARAAPEHVRGANPATAGHGAAVAALPAAEVTGVGEQTINEPAAYVTLTRDGEALGTWLVAGGFARTPHFTGRQPVPVDGGTFGIELRPRRYYKPYTLHVIEFRHDRFIGTNIPRNFSSRVRLVDPAHDEDREVLIRMNEPLYYRGESFYQFQMDPTKTVLQVVRNPGWVLPYVSCGLVAAGLLFHFGASMQRFTGRDAT